MSKHTKKQLLERVGFLSIRNSLYRLVILLLAVTVAGLITVPVFADYIQSGGQAPKIGNVEVYNEAPAQPVVESDTLSSAPEGDIEDAGAKLYYVPQDFLQGFEIKGDQYLDEDGLRAKSAVEGAADLSATTTEAYQLLFVWHNKLSDNEDVWVRDFSIDVIAALTSYGGRLNCGTSTASTTGYLGSGVVGSHATESDTIINDWYITSTFTSGDAPNGLINVRNATTSSTTGTFFAAAVTENSTSTNDFLIKTDESFTCTLTPDEGASTTDFLASGGFTGEIRYHLDIQHRNN